MIAVWMGALLLQNAAFLAEELAGNRLTVVNGYAVIEVSIEGRGPFRMMLDTGAASCSLSPDAAKTAHLALDHRVVLTTIVGERVVPGASNAHLRIGTSEARGVEVLAMEPDAVRAAIGPVDGVLGQSFLSKFPYLIDYRDQRLWLGAAAVRRALDLPAEIGAERSEGRVVVPVAIGAGVGPWRLTLDSGATAIVLRCGGRCPKLRKARSGDRIVTNAGSSARVRHGMLPAVRVGDKVLEWAEAALIDGPASTSEDGVLPANWFSAVFVDPARSIVRLR
ncbi:MAG TPA: aspartyl protease family protein [Bryobacteraceae bacterium]|nr:aspartyl protease family protein [Bryobacteraceae bacterium]